MAKPETATLTLRIDAELKRKLEEGAVASNLSMDEHVAWLLEEAIFINSPEFFDPNNWEAQEYRLVRESIESSMLGHDVPLEEVEKEIEQRFGAERSSDLPSAS
jgi:predicted transcriptional regulator